MLLLSSGSSTVADVELAGPSGGTVDDLSSCPRPGVGVA